MTNSHRPITITAALMAIVLVAGSIGSAAAGLQECLPKACCCMTGGHKVALHIRQIGTKSGCAGIAPCCRIEPTHKSQHLAALTSRAELPKAKESFRPIIAGRQFVAQLRPRQARTFQHNGKPRAPLVPVYLETQMLLC